MFQTDPAQPQAANQRMPKIEPNLADDKELCDAVLSYVYRNYAYPYLMNQQRLWPAWDAIDSAWRGGTFNADLKYDPLEQRSQEWLKRGSSNAGSAAITPPALYSQVNTLTAFAFSSSWKEGMPARFVKPATLTEHPMYNPATRAVQAANERAQQEAELTDLKSLYRKCYPDYLKYSHTWVLFDFDRRFEEVMTETGPTLVPKTFFTTASKLNVDQVYVDYMVGLDNMEDQDCPIIRRSMTNTALFKNRYNSDTMPFGWLNVDLAAKESANVYTLAGTDMGFAQALLRTRYGISDSSGGQRPYFTFKNLYTAYANLCLYQDPATAKWKLHEPDKNDPIKATGPDGQEYIVDVNPARYIVEWYGFAGATWGGTCLRIQRNPTAGDRVPLSCIRHKIEDTALSIPVSVCEIGWSSYQQLSTAINQFLDSKNFTINRPHLTTEPGLVKKNLNKPGENILVDDLNMSVKRADGNNYDDSVTLLPFMQFSSSQFEEVMGANSTMRGEIGTGRRAASEVVAAFDSARAPAVLDVDNFNGGFAGKYLEFCKLNWDAWGDQQWIQEKTGTTYWPHMQIRSTTAQEYVDKLQQSSQIRYYLEMLGNNPMAQQYIEWPTALVFLAEQSGIQGMENIINDGGLEVAREKAMELVTQILGYGKALPPDPDDPDELYITCFKQALSSKYWQERAVQNFPIMYQRIALQQQQAQIKQIQAAQAQLENTMLQATIQNVYEPPKGAAKEAEKGQQSPQRTPSTTPGQVAQSEMGSQQG